MSVSLNHVMLYGVDTSEAEEPGRTESVRTMEDGALVSRAGAGNMAAFEELVRRYRNDVYGFAFHFLRDREEAWDTSQEVFIKVHKNLKRFRGDASFKTWLLRITANHCKDVLKKRRLRTVNIDDVGDNMATRSKAPGPSGDMEAQEIGKAIDEGLESLSPKHRTAFVLREFEGLSYQEMAEVMDCNMGTVMSRLHHARKKLQSFLLRKGIVEETSHA